MFRTPPSSRKSLLDVHDAFPTLPIRSPSTVHFATPPGMTILQSQAKSKKLEQLKKDMRLDVVPKSNPMQTNIVVTIPLTRSQTTSLRPDAHYLVTEKPQHNQQTAHTPDEATRTPDEAMQNPDVVTYTPAESTHTPDELTHTPNEATQPSTKDSLTTPATINEELKEEQKKMLAAQTVLTDLTTTISHEKSKIPKSAQNEIMTKMLMLYNIIVDQRLELAFLRGKATTTQSYQQPPIQPLTAPPYKSYRNAAATHIHTPQQHNLPKQALLPTPSLHLPFTQPPKQLFVKATNEDIPTEEIQRLLIQHVDPTKLKIRVSRPRPHGATGVAITCQDQNDLDTLTHYINNNGNLQTKVTAKTQRRFKPQLIIFNVDAQLSKTAILSAVLHQAGMNELCEEDIRCIATIPTRNAGSIHAIVETSTTAYRLLTQLPRICVGWSRCSYDTRVRPLRCYKCQDYGHTSASCKNEMRCENCSGRHNTYPCLAPTPTCANCAQYNGRTTACSPTNHKSSSNACPIYKAQCETHARLTDY